MIAGLRRLYDAASEQHSRPWGVTREGDRRHGIVVMRSLKGVLALSPCLATKIRTPEPYNAALLFILRTLNTIVDV